MNAKSFIFYLIFINLFLILASFQLTLGRPALNIDYLLLLIFCCLPKHIISHTLLALSFLFLYFIDVLLMVMQIFPFVRLTDLIYLSNFIFNGPILYRTLLLVVVISFFINFFVIRDYFLKKIKLNFKQYLYILFLAFLALLVKHLLNPLEEDEVYARFDKRLLDSQLLFFIKHQQSSFVESIGSNATKLEPSRFDTSTQPLFEQLQYQKNLSKKILLIVNESWGETAKPKHQAAILAPIYQKQNQLKFIKQGSFNFVGATVAGELRELCHKQPTTFNLKDAKAEEFENCLPKKLQQLGYETHAMHGAMSIMYDRSSWYPKAGFEHLYFFEQLSDAGLCRAFSGRCDTHLIGDVKKFLLDHDKSFVYWLTLNTHAPYDDIVMQPSLNCNQLNVKEGTETCNNYKLQHQFFNGLSQIINDPAMKGLEVYVVGDHSPPIFNMSDNFFSFKGSEVAWIHFKIKE